MEFNDLPPHLEELEGAIAGRLRAEPAAEFRGRVLAAVSRQLHGGAGNGSMWGFAAAVAAAMLLGINLSMTAANHMEWRLANRLDHAQVETQARQIRALAPEFSTQDAQRYAVLLHVKAAAPAVPRIHWSRSDISMRAEYEAWATP